MDSNNIDDIVASDGGQAREPQRVPVLYEVHLDEKKKPRPPIFWAFMTVAAAVVMAVTAAIVVPIVLTHTGGAPTVCVSVAKELESILHDETTQVSLPLVGAVQSAGEGDLDTASNTLNAATTSIKDLTDRVNAVAPDYQECVK